MGWTALSISQFHRSVMNNCLEWCPYISQWVTNILKHRLIQQPYVVFTTPSSAFPLTGTPTLGVLPPPSSLQSVAITPSLPSIIPTEQEGNTQSIACLLNTPIPTPVITPNQALVLSPALPPIPNRLVEKIRAGHFVEMKELLGDNIALLQRLEEVQGTHTSQWTLPPNSAKLREVSSPLTWISCFLTYTAVRCRDEETHKLLIYSRLVMDLARKHGGRGWLDYDRVFRQQIAANPMFPWAELNPSLMAYTVLGNDGNQNRGTWCPLCQEADHRAGECALQTLEPTPSSSSRTGLSRPPKFRSRYDPLGEICRKYNRGLCTNTSCKYKHICKECHKEHPFLSCSNREGDPKKS